MKKLLLVLKVFFATVFVMCLIYIVYYKYSAYVERQKMETIQQQVSQSEEQEQLENEKVKKAVEQIINAVPEATIIPEQEISESSDINSQEPEEPEELAEPEEPQVLEKYQSLLEQNSDLFGWIKIENTVIDYPVMQTKENQNFYLTKDFYKEESKEGVPYVDMDVNETSNNVIIYGHSLTYDSMFTCLLNYKYQQYYNEHKYIQFDTLYEEGTYEVISVSKAMAYFSWEEIESVDYYFYVHINMDSEEEFNEYVSKAKENAWFETGVSAEYGDELITLSTCDYWADDARLLIIAKKVN